MTFATFVYGISTVEFALFSANKYSSQRTMFLESQYADCKCLEWNCHHLRSPKRAQPSPPLCYYEKTKPIGKPLILRSLKCSKKSIEDSRSG